MFADSLHDARKSELLNIARLLHVFEAPLLYDGKKEHELTSSSNIGKITFDLSETQKMSWQTVVRNYESRYRSDSTEIDEQLLHSIKGLRLLQQNDKTERLQIAERILKDTILKTPESASNSGTWPKVADVKTEKARKAAHQHSMQSRMVLFEAMLTSFDGAGLNETKKHLLQMASLAFDMDGQSFNELLAQAAALHKEMKRSTNLVLE